MATTSTADTGPTTTTNNPLPQTAQTPRPPQTPQAPQTPQPPQPPILLPVSHARDILPTPSAALRRCAAYLRARHRFWDAFPRGVYTRLPTPGTDLECGLHALILSARYQLSSPSSSSSVSGVTREGKVVGVRVPTLEELRAVYESEVVQGENANVGMGNGCWFTADQLAAVFAAWGKRFLGGEGVRCQMGWVMERDEEVGVEGWPVMMNTPEVDTGEVGEGIVRVWVWNDGGSLRGGVGHFEGIRRPSEEEVAAVEGLE
ncbi:uncharacterized protein B0H64DRAFT_462240 [Chaetomium fimeti]|uniref:Uncharacterized protein n=1 Tax=Chaetomium fimeti TaxID=1854472 RepID=A0AAE0LQN0_9PEZI|nr:hypothetical protein B0H64DRAFT_462240 [Chaetomium fimeti]